MITAQDINTIRFEQAKPGYNTEEVDNFLKQLADQTNALLKEKEDTDKKMEVLVESIRRYKADEEALKDAMIGAQKQARAVLSEAQEKAEAIITEAQQRAEMIISDANVKSDEIIGSTAARAKKERAALEEMQEAVKEFKRELLAMYKTHLELITSLPADDDEEEEEPQAEEAYAQPQEAEQTAADENMEATKVIDTAEIENGMKLSL